MAAPQQTNNVQQGPISDRDMEDWKGKFNKVLAQPSETINSKSSGGQWMTSFFGCFNPIDTCAITCCVPCLTFGKTHHRITRNGDMTSYEPVNTSCLLLWASGCVGLACIPVAMQRAELRQRYNLEGSCLVDIATACCCGCCDLIQQDKEAAAREPLNAGAGVKQQYQPDGGMSYPAQQ